MQRCDGPPYVESNFYIKVILIDDKIPSYFSEILIDRNHFILLSNDK